MPIEPSSSAAPWRPGETCAHARARRRADRIQPSLANLQIGHCNGYPNALARSSGRLATVWTLRIPNSVNKNNENSGSATTITTTTTTSTSTTGCRYLAGGGPRLACAAFALSKRTIVRRASEPPAELMMKAIKFVVMEKCTAGTAVTCALMLARPGGCSTETIKTVRVWKANYQPENREGVRTVCVWQRVLPFDSAGRSSCDDSEQA
jgi:hypothetical protein